VDFALTDEQEMLRATARQFVADVCPAERAKEWDERSTVPPELFQGMAPSPRRTAVTAAVRWS
jgi:alkylation response protein AidB-like acyl-CoA dehydrogenase